jgi:hypothetical protein
VRTLKKLILWFIRLIRLDESKYTADPQTRQRIYNSIRKQNNRKKEKES